MEERMKQFLMILVIGLTSTMSFAGELEKLVEDARLQNSKWAEMIIDMAPRIADYYQTSVFCRQFYDKIKSNQCSDELAKAFFDNKKHDSLADRYRNCKDIEDSQRQEVCKDKAIKAMLEVAAKEDSSKSQASKSKETHSSGALAGSR
jgi:hypothetical protein